jgi:predicted Zn-dependent peptidase
MELLNLLDGLFNRVPRGKRAAAVTPGLPTRKIESVSKDLEQIHLCLGTLSISQNHPRRYEAFILNAVLGGSMSSRLFQEVREKLGLAYSIYSYMTSHSDSGSLAVYAGTSRERFEEVIAIILREFKRLKTDPLDSEELENAKEQLKGNILLSLESSDNRMTKLAKNEIYFGRYQPLMEIVKGIDQVTPESILELSAELIDENYITLVMMGEISGLNFTPADLVL